MLVDIPHHAGLEALADGFCMVDTEQRVTYWNAAAERLFGVPRAEAVGRSLWEALPGGSTPALRARLERAVAEGASVRITLPSGAELIPRHLAVRATPLEAGGAALHFRDSSAEQRLTDQYSQLLESIRDGFLAVDREWRIVYINRVAELLLSLPRERAVGTDLRSLLPVRPASLSETLHATMQDREPHHLSLVRPEGRVFRDRSFDVWTHPLPDGGISLLFEDVSERLTHEMELARLAAEAEEANRAKSRFFAAVSHELRTPLNAIVGYTHLLSTHTYGEVPAGAARAAERASVCAEHLARLIDDVLLLTTAEVERLPVSPVPVALSQLLPAILEQQRRQAEAKGLRFALDVRPELPAIESDPERLRQLLSALVSNAIKFTSRGEVLVRARVRGGLDRDWMEIAVIDTGPGIEPGSRERIFEAFEQLVDDESRSDSLNRGAGLGLTIARQLSHRLRGRIEVGGEPGKGAEFRLLLPLRVDAAGSAPTNGEER